MVSVQLGVSVGEALVKHRPHALGTGCLADVAHDVVDRQLRLADR